MGSLLVTVRWRAEIYTAQLPASHLIISPCCFICVLKSFWKHSVLTFFFFFFLTLAETLGLRKIDLVKVSWLAGVQGPSGHDSAESRI